MAVGPSIYAHPPAPPSYFPTMKVGFPNYRDAEGAEYEATKVEESQESLRRVAKWVGARISGTAGLRVPTMEGVQVAFVGDWIVRDQDGIVYIYTEEDFKSEFREATARDL